MCCIFEIKNVHIFTNNSLLISLTNTGKSMSINCYNFKTMFKFILIYHDVYPIDLTVLQLEQVNLMKTHVHVHGGDALLHSAS